MYSKHGTICSQLIKFDLFYGFFFFILIFSTSATQMRTTSLRSLASLRMMSASLQSRDSMLRTLSSSFIWLPTPHLNSTQCLFRLPWGYCHVSARNSVLGEWRGLKTGIIIPLACFNIRTGFSDIGIKLWEKKVSTLVTDALTSVFIKKKLLL